MINTAQHDAIATRVRLFPRRAKIMATSRPIKAEIILSVA